MRERLAQRFGWLLVVVALLGSLMALVPSAGAQNAGDIVITEFVTANVTGFTDNTGEHEDWIELHNTTDSTIFLTNWSLSDSSNTHVFTGGVIEAGGYLVVVASGDPSRDTFFEPHVDFKLSRSGDELALRDPSGAISGAAWAPYPPQVDDVSYGIDPSGFEGFMVTATPGAANTTASAGVALPVAFSVPHGFYSSPQTVTMTTATPGATIRYTTDGSVPSTTNGQTAAPGSAITVSQTTTLRAVATRSGWIPSEATTASYLFTGDIVTQPQTAPSGWPADTADRRYGYGMNPALVVGNEALYEASLLSIPTLSIVGDTADFVDLYENSQQRGMDWEREVSVELIDPSGAQPGFTIDGGFRIRGGGSRRPSNPKHSMRLHFRDEYDGDLHYQFFDDGVGRYEAIGLGTNQHGSFHWVRPEYATWVRESWTRTSQGAMGQPYNKSDYVHVYLNGQYWGLFFTQERLTNGLGAEYFGGSESDYDVVLNDGTNWRYGGAKARDGTLDAWDSLWPLVNDLEVTNAEFNVLDAEVDLVNLADHYLLQFFSGDGDSSPAQHFHNGLQWVVSNNWRAMRNRTGEGPAGKWMFFDHDSEGTLCWGYENQFAIDNTPPWNLLTSPPADAGSDLKPAWLHEALLTHPTYRQIFTDRVALHMVDANGALTRANALARFDALVAEVSPAIDAEAARWGHFQVAPGEAPHGRDTWNAALDLARSCLSGRYDLLQSQLTDDGLWPSLVAPTVAPGTGVHAWSTPITIDTGAEPGDLWVTIDGSDPRSGDGTPSPGAFLYAGDGSLSIDGEGLVVRTRRLVGTAWSPMAEASYELSGPVGVSHVVVNEMNAVAPGQFLGGGVAGAVVNGVDATLGRIDGNGGDWFEVVVVDDDVDLRGWSFEVWNDHGSGLVRDAVLTLGQDPVFDGLRAGTIITISEDIADDVSYFPPGGDWHINLQANDAGDGAYLTTQSGFDITKDDSRVGVTDAAGQPDFLRVGEMTAPAAGVSAVEVFKLEAAPHAGVTPTDPDYDDGTSSSWGLPNVFGGGANTQDLSSLRFDFGDVSCDGLVNIVDALVIAQLTVGLRTDVGDCGAGPVAVGDAFVDAGDVNFDRTTNIVDALVIARCEVGLPSDFCPAP